MNINNIIRTVILTLNKENTPRGLGLGIALGLLAGLLPVCGLISLVIYLLAALLAINLSAFILTVVIAKFLGLIIHPFASMLGYVLLVKIKVLIPLWTLAYNIPLKNWSLFNNTQVLGSLIIGLFLFWPACKITALIMNRSK